MKKNYTKLAKYLGVFLGICAVFILGMTIGRMNSTVVTSNNTTPNYTITGDVKSEYNGVNVNILWEVWSQLESGYIKSDLDGQAMIYGAVKGLVKSLDDPYTAFLTPDETKTYQENNAGEYEGIGATLSQGDDGVVIESPVDKSPAQVAGIKAGDLIMKVDGKDVTDLSVYEVVALIRGKAGTQVALHIYRYSDKKEYDFTITRASIDIDNITVEKLDNNIVEIKISRFTESDLATFEKLWDKAVEQTQSYSPKGIIIDLRNNPGGYVSGVEYILNDFFKQGQVVFGEQNQSGAVTQHTVERAGRLLDVPVVVLVNEGSASASEIFSGAMQDLGRAKIVGMKTVGKGVEQKIITLSDGSLLQMVFQKWLTASGRNITKDEPITPDFLIEDPTEQMNKAIELLK